MEGLYFWEPVADSFYEFGFQPEQTVGSYYDLLHVEQTIEGWHAILMVWYVPEDEDIEEEAGLAMVDEQVFDDLDRAKSWCEERDAERQAQIGAEKWEIESLT